MDRRTFVRGAIATGAASAVPFHLFADNTGTLLSPSMSMFPVGSVRPKGWLLRQLQQQADGLSGHLDEVWEDAGPNSGWLGGSGESWERGPYWMDGLVPLAYLLDDARLKSKLQPWMDWTLRSQREDGNFGPVSSKTKGNDWWPRMVMLKALIQYSEASRDERVQPFLAKYFTYQLKTLPDEPLTNWAKYRWQDNFLAVMWLYDRTGDASLLKLAEFLHAQGHDWRGEFEHFTATRKTSKAFLTTAKKTGGYHETHGVDIAMGLKTAAVWSRVSRSASDRAFTEEMLRVLDTYHGLPNGMYSADEHLAGRDPNQGTELCTVVEVMYSLEQAIAASGSAALADRLEKIAFNALPAAISDDMWSHQYDQQPNQIECSLRPRPWTNNGPEANLFGLAPNFGCCAANFHQGWPKLVASLWMRAADGALTAIVYAPCEVNTEVGDAVVKLIVQTEYPFRNSVAIHVEASSAVEFPLRLRVPSRSDPRITLNGKALSPAAKDGYVTVRRRWRTGDTVQLEFSMEPRFVRGVGETVSVMRGPLVFSLPIEERWKKLKDRGRASDWEIYGDSAWNFGLVPSAKLQVVKERPMGDVAFGKASRAVTLETEGVEISNWVAEHGNAGSFPEMPAWGETKPLTLVPYASAKLRVTAFLKVDREL